MWTNQEDFIQSPFSPTFFYFRFIPIKTVTVVCRFTIGLVLFDSLLKDYGFINVVLCTIHWKTSKIHIDFKFK